MLRVSEESNRRPEGFVESYHQLARTLLDLQHAADKVFDAIAQRTAEERDVLAGISRRIQSAKARIDAISQSGKDITITSPSKYPSGSVIKENFKPILASKDEESVTGSLLPKLFVNGGLNREFGQDGTLELFQFFSEDSTGNTIQDDFAKAAVKLARPSEGLNFEVQNWVDDSSSIEINSWSDSTLKSSKKDVLPPGPSSLLPKDFQSVSNSSNFKSKSTGEQAKE